MPLVRGIIHLPQPLRDLIFSSLLFLVSLLISSTICVGQTIALINNGFDYSGISSSTPFAKIQLGSKVCASLGSFRQCFDSPKGSSHQLRFGQLPTGTVLIYDDEGYVYEVYTKQQWDWMGVHQWSWKHFDADDDHQIIDPLIARH